MSNNPLPNKERVKFNGGIPLPLFNRSITVVPWPILIQLDPPLVITDPMTVIAVLATGSLTELTGFDPSLVILEASSLFGISGTEYAGSVSAVLAQDLASALPAGADLSVFNLVDHSSYWVSQFILPANDLVEVQAVPELSAIVLFVSGLAGLGFRRRRRNT